MGYVVVINVTRVIDVIRRMSDSELAEWLNEFYDYGYNDGLFAAFPDYGDVPRVNKSMFSDYNRIIEFLDMDSSCYS